MSRSDRSLPTSYFDDLYAGNPDPWGFESKPYEREKYAATLAALPRPHYAAALEIGCSIGVLTEQLAKRCDRLVALDAAEAPLARARQRLAGQAHVEILHGRVPEEWPEGHFDLILFSEVLYFFDEEDLKRVCTQVTRSLRPGGDVVLVHWLPETDFPLSGDEATERFIAGTADVLKPLVASRSEFYRMDTLRRID
ncbi:Nodulation protein S [Roseomonas mucosa]|jgi:SAM-dependent methyltransferase|uniref:Methyltransferase type 12 n=1 Tax=Roseomonas mucosa TaxID=207340 RepID=A0A1S8D7C3_9PROT|nr:MULTISPECIES: class I SAM-dependent methyltransferase [Roseomonas]MDT8262467.1 class I SAM-dependent methyltransferase [Roseomonas sp. DSM 102946]ATR19854.1 methyltransferase type 12 [Roseomonas sp. FDAARGOS_362]MDU7523144.1 class I SAM-dependent methyltransferase [Roseomonas mucosa]ONH83654.1 methyltransferase type 12 [Roseomonas mucosa]QDJ10651.1 Nodulation protein S [Roseomonas mucosa]